jgi:hypothetical protein
MTTTEDRKAKLAGDRGRVPPVKLAHIVRRTSRFDEMVRWYETVLGAHVVHADEMLAFLTYDTSTIASRSRGSPDSRTSRRSRQEPTTSRSRMRTSATCSTCTSVSRARASSRSGASTTA